jgi:hypothetical protein
LLPEEIETESGRILILADPIDPAFEPPALTAVMEYVVSLRDATGVPEISQVFLFTVSPLGSAGVVVVSAHFVMLLPLLFSRLGETLMGTPT